MLTIQQLAELLNKPEPRLREQITLVKLDSTLIEKVKSGQLTVSQAQEEQQKHIMCG